MSFKEAAEYFSHPVGRLSFVKSLQSGTLKSLWISLEYPRGASSFVLIGMGDERAPFGLLKNKCEGIERSGRTHPRKHIRAKVDFRLKVFNVFLAETTIDAIS